MDRTLGQAALAGLTGVLVLSLIVYVPPVGMLLAPVSPLPLLYVGLRDGMKSALVAVAVAFAVGLVIMPVTMVPGLLFVDLVPGLLLLALALRSKKGAEVVVFRDPSKKVELPRTLAKFWLSPGTIISWMTAVALVLLLAFAGLVNDSGQGVKAFVEATVNTGMDEALSVLPPETREATLGVVVAFLPGVFLAFWIIRIVGCAILAQALLGKQGQQSRPSPYYSKLDLPIWSVALFFTSLVLALVLTGDAAYVAASAAVISAVPLLFMGLVLVHRATMTLSPTCRAPALIFFYCLVITSSFPGYLGIVIAGIVEWLVRRMTPRGASADRLI